MRVGRQARLAAQLMAKIQQPLIVEPPQEISPRIDTRRRMPLEINKVPRLVAMRRVKEVVESHFKQRGQRRVSSKMAADSRILLVLAVYHRHRIPPNQALHTPLQIAVAGIGHLFVFGNGVEVGSGQLAGGRDSGFPRALTQRLEELRAALRALGNDNVIKGFDPLMDLVDKAGLYGDFCFCAHGNSQNIANFSVYSSEGAG